MNKYSLIGRDVEYSLSPSIHNYLFKKYKIDSNYQIHNCKSVSTDVLSQFKGGNITIPFKSDVYNLVGSSNFKDHSLNTFKQTNDGLEFMSTDQYGIIDTIYKLQLRYIETRLHVVFGDGATSAMIVSCLVDEFNVPQDKIYVISRKNFDLKVRPRVIDINYMKKNIISNYVLYNASPLGNGKNAKVSPFDNEIVCKALAIFDTSYNPTYNALAKLAYANRIRYINGANMLIVQGLHAFKFWTGINVEREYNIIKRHLYFENSSKMIICAMPFAGKSTLYRRHKRGVCDLDLEVERYTGIKNAEFINTHGIEKFRAAEAKVLKATLARKDIKMVFLGGGTLTNTDAINCLTKEFVVYMQVSLGTLMKRFDKSRANIQSREQLEKLYFERDKHYRNISQFQVGSRSIERMINEYLGD